MLRQDLVVKQCVSRNRSNEEIYRARNPGKITDSDMKNEKYSSITKTFLNF